MRFNDTTAGGESKPGAVGLGGEEGTEEVWDSLGRYARTVIFYGDFHFTIERSNFDADCRIGACCAAGFNGILQQRGNHVMKLGAFRQHQR